MSTKQIDCLFVHNPKMHNFYKPLQDFMWINYMPIGLMALADIAHKSGLSTRVVHLGVEWIEDESFSLLDYMAGKKVRILAMPLHWHHQSFETIQTARLVKQRYPDVFVVLGGFTATCFHDQILTEFPFVDAIVRGDGEVPFRELLGQLDAEQPALEKVPNLSYRQDGELKVNPLDYVATGPDLDDLNFANFSLMRNHKTYINYMGLPFIYVKGVSPQDNFNRFTIQSPLHHPAVGRGCSFNCTWCGGSNSAQKVLNGRSAPIFRSHEAVIENIRQAVSYGYETMHTCFDPQPKKDYYVQLFRKLKEAGVKCEWFFECYGLPTREFVDTFAEVFPGDRSVISINPETGSEEIRKANKGCYYSNAELMETLEYIDGKGVNMEIFFTYGVPFEKAPDLLKSVELRTEIARRFKKVQGMRTMSIEMEPLAPWSTDPDKYGVVTNLKRFKDYYNHHADRSTGCYSTLGYHIPGYFPGAPDTAETFQTLLQEQKCKHFCYIHPNQRRYLPPFLARKLCAATEMELKIRRKIKMVRSGKWSLQRALKI